MKHHPARTSPAQTTRRPEQGTRNIGGGSGTIGGGGGGGERSVGTKMTMYMPKHHLYEQGQLLSPVSLQKGLLNIKEDKDLEKNFASCFGAIKIIKDGWETEAIPVMGDKTTEKKGFFAKIFRIH